jgi:ABC-type multidrug transport system fused ATPase/permease subunit
MGLGQGGSITPDIAKAKGAGAALFEVIDRVPLINLNEGTGKTLDKLKGKIQFKNVKFAYPTRPEVTVMEKFSLTIKSGTTVALVGPSGGGKRFVSLLPAFYRNRAELTWVTVLPFN